MQTIAEFLQRKLWALNQDHPGIKRTGGSDGGIERVRRAIENHNANMTNDIGFEGIDLSQEELAQMKIAMPDAFRNKPVTYQATASHYDAEGELFGQTNFAIEVIN